MMFPCAESRYICDSTSVGPSPARARATAAPTVSYTSIGSRAVDRHARHAVRLRLDREILAVRAIRVLLLGARVDVVAVVLHHEHDRELPQRRDVQRLGERALLGGAVAEEAEDDLALAADLRRPGGAGRVRDARRRRSPTCRGSRSRRRSGASSRRCPCRGRRCAVDLGHHRLRVGAARDRVAVAAVRREELVVGPSVAIEPTIDASAPSARCV